MSLLSRLFLMLCVVAGLGAGMVHGSLHGEMDECASHCGHGHDGEHHDHEDPGTEPHHHACCHLPSADRVRDSLSLPTVFLAVLVEIAADRSLVPDEPVFALDKPPLI